MLTQLLREGKVEKFKVRSSCFWTRSDQQILIISAEKSRILTALSRPMRQCEIARIVCRTEKSATRRLVELSRLGLVEDVNPYWHRIAASKRVIVR